MLDRFPSQRFSLSVREHAEGHRTVYWGMSRTLLKLEVVPRELIYCVVEFDEGVNDGVLVDGSELAPALSACRSRRAHRAAPRRAKNPSIACPSATFNLVNCVVFVTVFSAHVQVLTFFGTLPCIVQSRKPGEGQPLHCGGRPQEESFCFSQYVRLLHRKY